MLKWHRKAEDGLGPLGQIQRESTVQKPHKKLTCSVSQYQPFIFQRRDFAARLHLQLATGRHRQVC